MDSNKVHTALSKNNYPAALGLLMLLAAMSSCKPDSQHASRSTDPKVLDLGGAMKIDLVEIPAGEFLIGSPDSEISIEFHEPSESPQHKVTIGKPFFMGKYPVTREQAVRLVTWYSGEFSDARRYPDVATNMKLPADSLAFSDCTGWCDLASKITGRKVRLPTEAEWEYACRAGTTTKFSCGDQLLSDYACFNSEGLPGGKRQSHSAPVGSCKPNPFGLYDMHGNVAQWVLDNFHETYEHAPTDGSAWINDKNKELHVYRGGSWLNGPETCRSAMRCAAGSDNDPDMRTSTVGFRVVVEK